jgi:hypothetical protein
MNWRDRLFWIWAVLSVIWVLGCAVYGYDQLRRTTFVITDPSGVRFDVRAPGRTTESDAVAFVQGSDTARAHRDNCARHPTAMCQSPLPLSMPNTIDFWPLLLAAIAGPLGSLLAGFLAFRLADRFRTPH